VRVKANSPLTDKPRISLPVQIIMFKRSKASPNPVLIPVSDPVLDPVPDPGLERLRIWIQMIIKCQILSAGFATLWIYLFTGLGR
jgi:hypothetical protein